MRLIDADALEELFREVIGNIAKRPEIGKDLEHMVRASAMAVQMIQDAPTVGGWISAKDRLPEMNDNEKVEEWARDFIAYIDELDITRDVYRGIMGYIDDALAMLRDQEPIKPIFPHNVPAFPRCGACSHMLVGPPLTADSEIKYCWHCGRKVKWNG